MSEQAVFDALKYRIEADEGGSTMVYACVTYTTKLLTLC